MILASDAIGRMPAVKLAGVTKRFGQHTAVDDLSLTVPAGSVYGFIGPNGSGKTTTLRMILHIFHPDGGEIEVLGERSTRAANDRIGYLPEERGLYKKMTVRRVLAYYAALKGMKSRDSRAAIGTWEGYRRVRWRFALYARRVRSRVSSWRVWDCVAIMLKRWE
ncbi:MAG TPA: ATP-binding cassette domain-containing protein [Verrucomicrobiales bacterium]|nr:ATP-binding cassette domain-containing protein [Verrucomicrobiales bacterium]